MHTLDSTLRMLWFISGCYFIYTGASKMASPRPLLTAILSYRITGPHISRALAALTAPTEFFCGLLLASGVFPSGSAALLIALLLVSCTGMAIVLFRGYASGDGGYGSGHRTGPARVRPSELLRHLILIAALATAVVADHPTRTIDQTILAAIMALVVIGVSIGLFRILATAHPEYPLTEGPAARPHARTRGIDGQVGRPGAPH
ncbi:MauE/DoxX family redox-associated membrane protein [Actinomyces capricornis]|uniref:Methylamine utilisation protein MauE domain-containing protein n=1 Tax=Actinomyces capricornis TaxID=2755559 RepID=A0ABN6K4C9_9ACTO|nr:MauE/DoxX family redox-associated membrane protein [Actinomyces capricornis]BDA63522.1 hypothetical protein MANAM107_03560 [Actinomyces capricornis]